MERIEAFEAMLRAALEQSEAERQKMEALKAQGKEKSATYRQYLGNRLFYTKPILKSIQKRKSMI